MYFLDFSSFLTGDQLLQMINQLLSEMVSLACDCQKMLPSDALEEM